MTPGRPSGLGPAGPGQLRGLARAALLACPRPVVRRSLPAGRAGGRVSTLDDVRLGPDVACVCAIGAFDGVHVGHRALLAEARRRADELGALVVAVTFDPDPARVLTQGYEGRDLLRVADRERGLLLAGADAVLTLGFDRELASLDAASFVRDVLRRAVSPRAVVVGDDFRMGAGGACDVDALARLGSEGGFDVAGVALSSVDGGAVSATRVRRLLLGGDVAAASRLLARPHVVWGTVAHGRGQGTGFGFPTANVDVDPACCLPAEGVYSCVAISRDGDGDADGACARAWPAAVNVGRPRSFADAGGPGPFLEATLLGFDGDLYGRGLGIAFVGWLRAPRAFDDLGELRRVVLSNVGSVRDALGGSGADLGGVFL